MTNLIEDKEEGEQIADVGANLLLASLLRGPAVCRMAVRRDRW
jgi:hypothetical protein